jgi:DNA transformation protein
VFDGRLYFKTHPNTLAEYEVLKMPIFAPSEKQILRNYREVPVDILEDAEQLRHWATQAAQP